MGTRHMGPSWQQTELRQLFERCIAEGLPLEISRQEYKLLGLRLMWDGVLRKQDDVAALMGISQVKVSELEVRLRSRFEYAINRARKVREAAEAIEAGDPLIVRF